MILKVYSRREVTGDDGTFSVLTVEGSQFRCRVGELPWRNNQPGLSCIRAGAYRATVQRSNRFEKDLYRLDDMNGRVAVEMHNGNWCGDVEKGYRSDVEGCLLLGFSVGDVMRPDKVMQKGVTQSVHALEQFMKATQEQPIELIISWFGINP